MLINNNYQDYFNLSPVNILSGPEGLNKILDYLQNKNILIVTTTGSLYRDSTKEMLSNFLEFPSEIFSDINPNPDIDELDAIISSLSKKKFDHIVALGGGSVIDSAKVLSATLGLEIDRPLSRYFRENKPINWARNIELTAIPTTSGTGSEVTPFATVWDYKYKKKYSLSGEFVYPTFALVEPNLTLSLNKEQTLYPGLDTISHALEAIWNKNSTNDSLNLASKSLNLIEKAFLRVLDDPTDYDNRSKMQHASLLSGVAISTTRTAIAHSISYPLTSRFNVPHGLACSFTLNSIIDYILNKDSLNFDSSTIINVKSTLVNLKLNKRISSYLSLEEAIDVLDEMYSPERADNFILDVTLKDIRNILEASFN